jgi:exopolysaccharide biosynthesis polyprenyl glycosylphosphotransferase
MLKQEARLFNRLSLLVDLSLILLALIFAHAACGKLGKAPQGLLYYLWIVPVTAPVWYVLMVRYRLNSSIRRESYFNIVTSLINVHVLGAIAAAAIIFLLDPAHYSRTLFLLFILFSFGLLTAEKIMLRWLLGFARQRGYNIRNLLIVGTQDKALSFHHLVERHDDWGLQILGFLQIGDEPWQASIEGHEVLGHVRDLVEICKRHPVDEVAFCVPKSYVGDVEAHLRDLEELGITVRMVLDFYDVRSSRRELGLFHDELPILTFHSKAFDAGQLFLKRLLDITGALVGLSITTVLFPFIAFAIRRDSPGPLLFSQERVGMSGRSFKCWKFRSMYLDAEERKQELMAQNEMKGAMFKIKDDPRITKVGKFLRKTSLDELPQFWNVLKGEMSLVGTRPPTPAEVAQYENWHRRRISIKPGISGLWQVSGRSRVDDFDDIVRLDLDYIDNWSVWFDIRILVKTVLVVFRQEGSS